MHVIYNVLLPYPLKEDKISKIELEKIYSLLDQIDPKDNN